MCGQCFILTAHLLLPVGATLQLHLQTLYKRLVLAEQLGGQVRKDLSDVLEELRNLSRTVNSTKRTPTGTGADKPDTDKFDSCG